MDEEYRFFKAMATKWSTGKVHTARFDEGLGKWVAACQGYDLESYWSGRVLPTTHIYVLTCKSCIKEVDRLSYLTGLPPMF